MDRREAEDEVVATWARGDVRDFARAVSRPYYNFILVPRSHPAYASLSHDGAYTPVWFRRPIARRDTATTLFPWHEGDTLRLFDRDTRELVLHGRIELVSGADRATGHVLLPGGGRAPRR